MEKECTKTLLERIMWQVRVWSHHSGHLPRKNPIQLIRLQATPWKSSLSRVILIFLLATCCWDCHQPLRWTTSNLVYFTWSSHGSFLTVTLLRQSVLIDILCLARSCSTEAAGCLLLLSAEKPDLESETHVMNQTVLKLGYIAWSVLS